MVFWKRWPIFFSLPVPGGPRMCTSIRFLYQHLTSCWCNEAPGLVQMWPPGRSRGGISGSEVTWGGRWDSCADLNEVHVQAFFFQLCSLVTSVVHTDTCLNLSYSNWFGIAVLELRASSAPCPSFPLATNIENREVAGSYSLCSAALQLRIICLIWKWVTQR